MRVKGLRGLRLRKIARILHDQFMDVCHCDVFRTSREFDPVTGADTQHVDFDAPIYENVDCYLSQHPWYPPENDSNEARVSERANYRVHVQPDLDIRTGDVISVTLDNGVRRLFIVPRVAYYPTHSRLECFEWDYRNSNIDLTGVVSVPTWGMLD